MIRRRCTPLSRAMLTAAFGCARHTKASDVRTVFASRYGSINEPIEDRGVARGLPISPASSATLRTTPRRLDRRGQPPPRARWPPSGQLRPGLARASPLRDRRPLLFAIGDVPLAPTFAPLVKEPVCSYAVAWLLGAGDAGDLVSFELGGMPRAASGLAWPDAVEWLRWWLSGEPALEIAGARLRFAWRRG
jgi:hypothetical protein